MKSSVEESVCWCRQIKRVCMCVGILKLIVQVEGNKIELLEYSSRLPLIFSLSNLRVFIIYMVNNGTSYV